MPEPAADGRALQLFELVSEHPERREALLAKEADAVLAAFARLEEAAPRARAAFPTEEDAAPRTHLLPLPRRIGAYRLGARLGEGGMGMVFAADRCDGLFEHRVAVKLIHPDRFSDRALDRFAAERRLLARLDHPGIARLIDGGVDDGGWPFIIMERVDGVPIDVAALGLPLAARMGLLVQVCDAVSAAHAALVVHGDLKPANILVNAAGRVRLLDFGVARLIGDEAASGGAHTRAFASPAQREGAAPGVADDVHALGVLLRAVVGAGTPDAHRRAPADRDLAAIAAKAAAGAPGDRYRSVDALASDLARWRAGRTVAARSPSWRYRVDRFVRRNRRPLAAAALVLAMLAGLGAASIAGWQEARARDAIAAARTGELRQLAHYQLFVVAASLEHRPRTTRLRRGLVREAQRMLASAVAAPGATPSLRVEAAEAYRLLAAIEGAPDRPSLGDTDAALRSLARAAALVRGDRSVAGRAALTAILLDQAQLAGWGGRADDALTLLAQARRVLPPGQPRLARGLALARADMLVWNGDYAEAIRVAAALAPAFAQAPATVDAVLDRDRWTDRLAEATFYAGDPAGALVLYRRAAASLEAAQRRWPDDPAIVWALARQRWNVGTTLLEQGRPAAAMRSLEQARDAMAATVAADPDDAMAMRRLRGYDLARAQALAALGRTDQAVAAMQANIAARSRWQALAPHNAERLRDLAIALAALGDVHAQAGDRARACARYRDVRALHDRLSRLRRLSRLDSGYFAGLVARSMARLHCQIGGAYAFRL